MMILNAVDGSCLWSSFRQAICFEGLDLSGRELVGFLSKRTAGAEQMEHDVAGLLATTRDLNPHQVILDTPTCTMFSALDPSVTAPETDTATVHHAVGTTGTTEVAFNNSIRISCSAWEATKHGKAGRNNTIWCSTTTKERVLEWWSGVIIVRTEKGG